jgi:hypothetical protein
VLNKGKCLIGEEGIALSQHPFSAFRDHLIDPISKGIIAEVRDPEDTLCRSQELECKYFEFGPGTYYTARTKVQIAWSLLQVRIRTSS